MKHFKEYEFVCKCGACENGFEDMDTDLLSRLDRARELSGVPFVITSAVRCVTHNLKIGGNANSAHLTGNAVDILTTSGGARFLIISALLDVGFNRIGVYDTFIHVDNDKTKPARVIWSGGEN